ncbi:FMN reductase [Leminorella grimontii]|uniref:Flavoprotein WrbA n=1 Tax=Leminorella grimontii TaxID=82981 RepID=A0AAV5MXA9_9GAMM|nr:flavodoxin family protein [Leminorella grimontii]GKX54310.1 FMN reductase [Leminorella grimontii]VFS59552.1 Trp repressor-binding protein [Leminorella grimontii]
MTHIVMVFHSGYGHTAKAADAVAKGIGEVNGVRLEAFAIDAEGNLSEQGWAALAAADAIVFGSPTYMSGPSWQFKRFADASSRQWVAQQWKDKLFAGFTNSASMNGDKLSTLDYLFHLSQEHGGVWVGMGMLPSNTKAATRNDVNYVAGFSGLMTVSPADASVEEAPLPGDLETARLFGQRVAQAALRWSGRSQ